MRIRFNKKYFRSLNIIIEEAYKYLAPLVIQYKTAKEVGSYINELINFEAHHPLIIISYFFFFFFFFSEKNVDARIDNDSNFK